MRQTQACLLVYSMYPVWPLLFRIASRWKALSCSSYLPSSWPESWSYSLWNRTVHKPVRPLWRLERLPKRWINIMAWWRKSRTLESRPKVRWGCSRSPLKWREAWTTRATVHYKVNAIAVTSHIRSDSSAMLKLGNHSIWSEGKALGTRSHRPSFRPFST